MEREQLHAIKKTKVTLNRKSHLSHSHIHILYTFTCSLICIVAVTSSMTN